jgi:hypothetical protein
VVDTRLVAIGLALVAAVSLTAASGGFSAVTADRSVGVAVVDHEDAYVGVQAAAAKNGTDVTVTNRYDGDVTVERIAGNESVVHPDVRLAPGESATFETDLASDTVTVAVEGSDLRARIDATVNESTAG